MVKELMEYQERHLEEILKAMHTFEEEFKRCGGVFTAILVYGTGSLRDTTILERTRHTDQLFKLEENLFLIILSETNIKGGIVAAEKLLPNLSKKTGENVYVAVTESRKGREGTLMVHTLFNILEFAIKHHHENEVLDNSYLDSVY